MAINKLIAYEYMQRLGWPGLAGIALMLVALLYAFFALLPARENLQHISLQVVQTQQYLNQIKDGILPPPTAEGSELETFLGMLPQQAEATRAIDQIYTQAQLQNIALARGEYSLGVDPKTRMARYQILLPVSGSYPQLRRFLHAVLSQVPALVLENVDIKRKQIADVQLDGRVRMTLYLSRRI